MTPTPSANPHGAWIFLKALRFPPRSDISGSAVACLHGTTNLDAEGEQARSLFCARQGGEDLAQINALACQRRSPRAHFFENRGRVGTEVHVSVPAPFFKCSVLADRHWVGTELRDSVPKLASIVRHGRAGSSKSPAMHNSCCFLNGESL